MAREVGAAILPTQVEITEELTTTQKEESVPQQQVIIKKITRHVTVLTLFIPILSVIIDSKNPFTIQRWLHHRAILI